MHRDPEAPPGAGYGDQVSEPGAAVAGYLAAVARQDWEMVSACVTDGVVRIGPFGDRYEGRGPYVAFLRDLMPRLAGYQMEVHRILTVPGGATVVAELTETVQMEGRLVITPECLVFGLDQSDRIATITIYIQVEGDGRNLR